MTQAQSLGINAIRHHQSGKTAKRVLMPVINAKLPAVHPDVDPGKESRMNESLQPAKLGRGLDHETHQADAREIFRKL